MSQRSGHHMKKCFPPLKPIVCAPVNVVKEHYHPQIQPVIHPVQIINKHHPVPIPVHEWVVAETEEGVGGMSTGMNGMNGVAGTSMMNGVGGMYGKGYHLDRGKRGRR